MAREYRYKDIKFLGLVKTLLGESTVLTQAQRLQLQNIALTNEEAADLLSAVVEEYERRLQKGRRLWQFEKERADILQRQLETLPDVHAWRFGLFQTISPEDRERILQCYGRG